MRGIYTVQDLMDRCRVDQDTGCWTWGQSSCSKGMPAIWFPPLGGRVTLGTVAGFLRTGERPPKGVYWYCTCETENCANPEHRKPGSRRQQMRQHAKPIPPLRRAKIAATKRAQSAIDDKVIQEIRESPESLLKIAARLGVSPSYCSRVRRGELRASLAAPGSSVFAPMLEAA